MSRGSQTQTLSKLTSQKADAKRVSLNKAQAFHDKENVSQNSNPHNNSNDHSPKRNSLINGDQVSLGGKRNSYDSASETGKDQRNKTSLVRDGYSTLKNLNSKNNLRSKAKINQTPRQSIDDSRSMGSNAFLTDGGDRLTNGDLETIGQDGSDQIDLGGGNNILSVRSGQKQPRTKGQDVPSVRKRFYENAEMEDVLQEKVATQLRENGIAETRVASLSAKISQAVRDDVIGASEKSQPQVLSNLTSTIHHHLDVILYNYPQHTQVGQSARPHDATNLSQIVLMRVAQIHKELDSCKQSLDNALKYSPRRARLAESHGETATPRDAAESQERSVIMVIKEGIESQKTEAEIMAGKIKYLESEGDSAEKMKDIHKNSFKALDEENWQLKKCLQEADQDNEVLIAKVKDQEVEQTKLEKSLQATQKEIDHLKSQIGEMKSQGRITAKELAAMQSEKARLQVLCDQRQKEIVHLRDPDRDLLLQIRALKEEITVLRTQSRRLGEERGMLRSKSQKMESALDESLKIRTKVTNERDTLFKENQELRQRYRKLSLSTPQRTLPEILTPRNSLSTRSSSRSTSRGEANVLTLKNISRDGSRLSTHREELEEEQES